MKLNLEEIARALQTQDRIIEIENREIKELLGGHYLQEGKAILLYGSLSGPVAILLGVELIGINMGQLVYCTLFFNREGKFERACLKKFEPSIWFINESWIDFLRTAGQGVDTSGQEFDILRIYRNGSSCDGSSNTKLSENVVHRLGMH